MPAILADGCARPLISQFYRDGRLLLSAAARTIMLTIIRKSEGTLLAKRVT